MPSCGQRFVYTVTSSGHTHTHKLRFVLAHAYLYIIYIYLYVYLTRSLSLSLSYCSRTSRCHKSTVCTYVEETAADGGKKFVPRSLPRCLFAPSRRETVAIVPTIIVDSLTVRTRLALGLPKIAAVLKTRDPARTRVGAQILLDMTRQGFYRFRLIIYDTSTLQFTKLEIVTDTL